ncbi:hypothetical protein [Methanococcoides seepicolus]|uniref:Uncharacterized protein n=1 Tax=Methanococcoides seepicolus TaxID=2828780 RepID=A0A9E5DAQ4_9EURY|nr:hypothetical protein [Methanococcoides seepicolus]MCM1986920.1 hypothetical protein [Methanococcoides seepicolus]
MATWEESRGRLEVIRITEEQYTIKMIPLAVAVCTSDREVAEAYSEHLVHEKSFQYWK